MNWRTVTKRHEPAPCDYCDGTIAVNEKHHFSQHKERGGKRNQGIRLNPRS